MTREQAIERILAVWPAQQLSTGRDVLAQRLVAALEVLDLIHIDRPRFEMSEAEISAKPAIEGELVPLPDYISKRDRS